MPTPTEIITNPADFISVREIFPAAWTATKAQRGQSVDLSKTGAPAHLIIDETSLIARIRNHAARKGYRLAATS